MTAIIDVVVPIFAIIGCGYAVGRFGLMGSASSEALNRFVFYISLPALFFISMVRAPIEAVLDWPFITTFLGGLLVSFGAALAIHRVAMRDAPGAAPLHAMAAVFSNTGYMGIPLATAAFGATATLPAVIATLCTGAVLMPLCAIMVKLATAGPSNPAQATRAALAAGLRNPLVIAAVAGVLWSLTLGADALPAALSRFFDMLAATAGPCALFAMGLFMVGRRLSDGWREVAWVTVVKLCIHPAITFGLALAFGLSPGGLAIAVTLAALPTGTLVYVLAQQQDIYVQRAVSVVIFSTLISIVTLSIVLFYFSDIVKN